MLDPLAPRFNRLTTELTDTPDQANAALAASLAAPGDLTAPNGKPIYTLDQVVTNFLRDHEAWSTGATITYSFLDFLPAGTPGGVGFAPVTEIEKQFIRAAFDLISDVANLSFVEAPPNGQSYNTSTRIVFGLDTASEDFEWGYTRTRTTFGSPNDRIAGAQIFFNPDAVNSRQWIYGGYNFMATIHEILHALGLPHPGDYNADGEPITYVADAEYYQDSRQYTVLSYFDASNTGADFFLDAKNGLYSGATPLLHDVAALQALYGANTNTRTGDTVYGYNSNAGRISYDITLATAPIFTIWDGGGNDTLDLSGSTLSARLDLNEGAFSDAESLTGNISIAFGAKIENAKGGSAGDILIGNALANRLEGGGGADEIVGGGGDDVLLGGSGADLASYAVGSSQYAWWSNPDGTWTVQDQRTGRPDGQDSLAEIESLKFADRTVKILNLTNAEALTNAFENVLRYAPAAAADTAYVGGLASQVGSGALTLAQAFGQIVQRADQTTAVAALSYEFFIGTAPSKGGFDYLVSPTGPNPNNINSAYFQSFSIENRYINFAVNLGSAGEGRADFEAQYGTKSLFETTRTAYAKIFGAAPTDAKIHDLLDTHVLVGGQDITRAEYLAIYGGGGVESLGTKAALVGFLLTEAAKGDLGVYGHTVTDYLTDLADGARFLVDLVGTYNRPEYVFDGSGV